MISGEHLTMANGHEWRQGARDVESEVEESTGNLFVDQFLVAFAFGRRLTPALSDMSWRRFHVSAGTSADRAAVWFGVSVAVEFSKQQDERKGIADKDVLHPPGEGTAGQDGVQSQHDAGRELDLCEVHRRQESELRIVSVSKKGVIFCLA